MQHSTPMHRIPVFAGYPPGIEGFMRTDGNLPLVDPVTRA